MRLSPRVLRKETALTLHVKASPTVRINVASVAKLVIMCYSSTLSLMHTLSQLDTICGLVSRSSSELRTL